MLMHFLRIFSGCFRIKMSGPKMKELWHYYWRRRADWLRAVRWESLEVQMSLESPMGLSWKFSFTGAHLLLFLVLIANLQFIRNGADAQNGAKSGKSNVKNWLRVDRIWVNPSIARLSRRVICWMPNEQRTTMLTSFHRGSLSCPAETCRCAICHCSSI